MIRADNTTETVSKRGTREQLRKALAELAELSPDWRLGQMVCNVTDYAGDGTSPPTVWDATDEELLVAAQELIKHRRELRSQSGYA